MYDENWKLLRNLDDAGCDAKMKNTFMRLYASGRMEQSESLLREHRKKLLDDLHTKQVEIDCLDFLLFRMHNSNGENIGR